MSQLPLMVEMTGLCAVVIGGGKVACKRAKALVENGAIVTIISPHLTDSLQELVSLGKIKWLDKRFEASDAREAFLLVVATDDEEVNERVLQVAAHIPLINDATNAERGNITFPGVFRKGKLTISVSTAGASPGLTSSILSKIREHYDDYGPYVDFLYECRQQIKHSSMDEGEKRRLLREIVEERYKDEEEQRQFKEAIDRRW
ncbi:precorrin-2 dehydrogenase [Pontibacillus chungwhensis BH030062]|uniref:precorrin-2 dehydrogenase n=1 Tax=Pontibacillus chungwhensis BH030062 TaxID=1385513 RepID=A0A0A2US01_9BACI|nr:NAD(P)-binding protein [Pontibacillus chungwhensis]KGP91082.1 precorrin-2 dehydrogenase [Pontibacillus chungwhensis BH030062]